MTETFQVLVDPNKIPIDIIVISHGRWELTKLCMDNLYMYTTCPFHLIIVDDSTDLAPLEIAAELKKHNNITYVHSDVPYKSGNQVFNVGLSKCKHDFVATVMNSVTVQPEWNVGPILIMLAQPKAGTVGLKCLFPWGTIETTGIEISTLQDYGGVKIAGYVPTDIGANMPAHLLCLNYERPAVQWAFALHRKEALIGNMDENVFHGFVGWDDIDNCFVLRKKGWKIFYCGSGAGYHLPRATRGAADDDTARIRLNRENGDIFRKRWGLEVEKNLVVTPTKVVSRPHAAAPLNRAARRRLAKV